MKKLIVLFMILTLGLALSACEEGAENSSSQISESSEIAGSQVSEPGEVPGEDEASDSSLPNEEDPSGGESAVSGENPEEGQANVGPVDPIEIGNMEFRQLFADNPIDSAFSDDWNRAVTNSEKMAACGDASELWKGNIDLFYQELLSQLSENEKTALRNEQNHWSLNAENEIAVLSDSVRDSAAPGVESARLAMGYYRDRAASLAFAIFEQTGSMPEFSTTPVGAVG